jgi:hypothetical protein
MAMHPKGYVDAIAVVVPKMRAGNLFHPVASVRQALVEQEHRQAAPCVCCSVW